MARRLLRFAVTFAVALCAWLVVRPAHAEGIGAPLCDARGATSLAPAPQLQALLLSIGEVPETPCGDDAAFQRSVNPSQGPSWEASAPEAAAVPRGFVLIAPVEPAPRPQGAVGLRGAIGVRGSLDRPPQG